MQGLEVYRHRHPAAEATRTESMVQQNIRMCIAFRCASARRAPNHAKDILGVLYLDSRLQAGKLSQVDNDLLETIATEAARWWKTPSLPRQRNRRAATAKN